MVGHTFKEFQEIAKGYEKGDDHIDWSNDTDVYMNIEKSYWDHVDNQMGKDLKVEYAADLDAKRFGSGFGNRTQKILHEKQPNYTTHHWNFANFQNQKNSFFQFHKSIFYIICIYIIRQKIDFKI